MATGIKAAGVDLDSILEARSTTKIADVNIKSNGGVDLSNRFEKVASGSAPSATGIKSGGADLNTLFAAIDSVMLLGAGSGGNVTQLDGNSPYDSTVAIRFNVDGSIETGKSINGAAITWTYVGDWIDPTSGADNSYSVRFTNFNGTGGGDWTSEAAADNVWVALVDAGRAWYMTSTIEETINFACDFEVRKTAGAPPSTGSASYTFGITNTV